MDCEESLELLSEYHANALGVPERDGVRQHLDGCPPCCDVLHDVEAIVLTAPSLREEESISFPDEKTVWQRIQFS
jgi:hypothetical protein